MPTRVFAPKNVLTGVHYTIIFNSFSSFKLFVRGVVFPRLVTQWVGLTSTENLKEWPELEKLLSALSSLPSFLFTKR